MSRDARSCARPNTAKACCRDSASAPGSDGAHPAQVALGPGTTVEDAERQLIQMTLEHTRDNKTRAAEILGISLKTLHNKLNRLRLRPKKKAE